MAQQEDDYLPVPVVPDAVEPVGEFQRVADYVPEPTPDYGPDFAAPPTVGEIIDPMALRGQQPVGSGGARWTDPGRPEEMPPEGMAWTVNGVQLLNPDGTPAPLPAIPPSSGYGQAFGPRAEETGDLDRRVGPTQPPEQPEEFPTTAAPREYRPTGDPERMAAAAGMGSTRQAGQVDPVADAVKQSSGRLQNSEGNLLGQLGKGLEGAMDYAKAGSMMVQLLGNEGLRVRYGEHVNTIVARTGRDIDDPLVRMAAAIMVQDERPDAFVIPWRYLLGVLPGGQRYLFDENLKGGVGEKGLTELMFDPFNAVGGAGFEGAVLRAMGKAASLAPKAAWWAVEGAEAAVQGRRTAGLGAGYLAKYEPTPVGAARLSKGREREILNLPATEPTAGELAADLRRIAEENNDPALRRQHLGPNAGRKGYTTVADGHGSGSGIGEVETRTGQRPRVVGGGKTSTPEAEAYKAKNVARFKKHADEMDEVSTEIDYLDKSEAVAWGTLTPDQQLRVLPTKDPEGDWEVYVEALGAARTPEEAAEVLRAARTHGEEIYRLKNPDPAPGEVPFHDPLPKMLVGDDSTALLAKREVLAAKLESLRQDAKKLKVIGEQEAVEPIPQKYTMRNKSRVVKGRREMMPRAFEIIDENGRVVSTITGKKPAERAVYEMNLAEANARMDDLGRDNLVLQNETAGFDTAGTQAGADAAAKKAGATPGGEQQGLDMTAPGKSADVLPDALAPTVERITKEITGEGRALGNGIAVHDVPGELAAMREGGGRDGRLVMEKKARVFTVTDADGNVIGALRASETGPLSVAVDPAHRRQGIATKLYDAARAEGIDVTERIGKGGRTQAGVDFTEAYRAGRGTEAPLTVSREYDGLLGIRETKPDKSGKTFAVYDGPKIRSKHKTHEQAVRAAAAHVDPDDLADMSDEALETLDEMLDERFGPSAKPSTRSGDVVQAEGVASLAAVRKELNRRGLEVVDDFDDADDFLPDGMATADYNKGSTDPHDISTAEYGLKTLRDAIESHKKRLKTNDYGGAKRHEIEEAMEKSKSQLSKLEEWLGKSRALVAERGPVVKGKQSKAELALEKQNAETRAGNARYHEEVLADGPYGVITPQDIAATQAGHAGGAGPGYGNHRSRMLARGISHDAIDAMEQELLDSGRWLGDDVAGASKTVGDRQRAAISELDDDELRRISAEHPDEVAATDAAAELRRRGEVVDREPNLADELEVLLDDIAANDPEDRADLMEEFQQLLTGSPGWERSKEAGRIKAAIEELVELDKRVVEPTVDPFPLTKKKSKAKKDESLKMREPTDFGKVTQEIRDEVAARGGNEPLGVTAEQLRSMSWAEVNLLARKHLNEPMDDAVSMLDAYEGKGRWAAREPAAPVDIVLTEQVTKYPELVAEARRRVSEVEDAPVMELDEARWAEAQGTGVGTFPSGKVNVHRTDRTIRIGQSEYVRGSNSELHEVMPRSAWTGESRTFDDVRREWDVTRRRGDFTGVMFDVGKGKKKIEYVYTGKEVTIVERGKPTRREDWSGIPDTRERVTEQDFVAGRVEDPAAREARLALDAQRLTDAAASSAASKGARTERARSRAAAAGTPPPPRDPPPTAAAAAPDPEAGDPAQISEYLRAAIADGDLAAAKGSRARFTDATGSSDHFSVTPEGKVYDAARGEVDEMLSSATWPDALHASDPARAAKKRAEWANKKVANGTWGEHMPQVPEGQKLVPADAQVAGEGEQVVPVSDAPVSRYPGAPVEPSTAEKFLDGQISAGDVAARVKGGVKGAGGPPNKPPKKGRKTAESDEDPARKADAEERDPENDGPDMVVWRVVDNADGTSTLGKLDLERGIVMKGERFADREAALITAETRNAENDAVTMISDSIDELHQTLYPTGPTLPALMSPGQAKATNAALAAEKKAAAADLARARSEYTREAERRGRDLTKQADDETKRLAKERAKNLTEESKRQGLPPSASRVTDEERAIVEERRRALLAASTPEDAPPTAPFESAKGGGGTQGTMFETPEEAVKRGANELLMSIPRTLSGVSRAVGTSLDIGTAFRQLGMFAARHPRAWASAMRDGGIAGYLNPVVARDRAHKLWVEVLNEGGDMLHFRGGDEFTGETVRLPEIVKKNPIVDRSNASFNASLNLANGRVFLSIVRNDAKQAAKAGRAPMSQQDKNALAWVLNHQTGYGYDPTKLGDAGKWLHEAASLLYSSQWQASRFGVYGDLKTALKNMATGQMRAADKEALSGGIMFAAANVAILGTLATTLGADLDMNINSTNFAQIQLGEVGGPGMGAAVAGLSAVGVSVNTRSDGTVWADFSSGLGSDARILAKLFPFGGDTGLISGRSISGSGKESDPYNPEFGDRNFFGVVFDWLAARGDPRTRVATSVFNRFGGDDQDATSSLASALVSAFIPMLVQDAADAAGLTEHLNAENLVDKLMEIPSWFSPAPPPAPTAAPARPGASTAPGRTAAPPPGSAWPTYRPSVTGPP